MQSPPESETLGQFATNIRLKNSIHISYIIQLPACLSSTYGGGLLSKEGIPPPLFVIMAHQGEKADDFSEWTTSALKVHIQVGEEALSKAKAMLDEDRVEVIERV